MELNKLREMVFELGRKAGFTDMEIFHQSSSNLQIKVFKGEVDSYTLAESGGYSFRGIYNGQVGYSYTEILDETSAKMLVRDAMENAQVIDDEDQPIIFAGSKEYPEFEGFSPGLAQVTAEQKIELAKLLEAKAYEYDKRVRTVNYCLVASGEDEVSIQNSKGLNLNQTGNGAYCYISVVVNEGEDTKTFGRFTSVRDFADFDAATLAKGAVEEAVGLLGASPVESGTYPVILRWEAATTLLGAFAGIFSAENVQKNVSLLKGKLNQQVATAAVTILDDPLLPQGMYSSPFDAEGVATKTKTVVDKGVLTTYLHNLKTAAKDGVESTGNASKASYKSNVGVAPSNMFIQPGTASLDEIIAGVDRGLVIVDLQGAHSGANPVSGDFSLGAFGYLVEKGKIVRPVNQITMAGNFLEMLQDVEAVGSDLKFGMPMGSMMGSPSLKIKGLAVAGK
jgi:PmbA protein